MVSTPNETKDQPLVVISYSKLEEEWVNQLVPLFPSDAHIRLAFNRVEDFPGGMDESSRRSIAEANILVMLLSPSYLTSSWIPNNANYTSEFEPASPKVQVVPVLVRECPWKDTTFLQRYTVSTASNSGKPIADAATELQPRALNAVVTRILNALGISESTSYKTLMLRAHSWDLFTRVGVFKTSMEARQILGRAWSLVRHADIGAAEISSEILLIAFAEHGKDNPTPEKTPQFLWNQLTKGRQGRKPYELLLRDSFPGAERAKAEELNSHILPPATPEMLDIVGLAASLSLQTEKLASPSAIARITARHLLAALIIEPLPDRSSAATEILSKLTDVNGLINRFFDFIVNAVPDDNHEAWRRILVVEAAGKTAKAPKPRQSKKPAVESVPEPNVPIPVEHIPQGSALSGSQPGDPLNAIATSEMVTERRPAKTVSPDQAASPTEQLATEDDLIDDNEAQEGDNIDLQPILAGFATDFWKGKDLLNTKTDVNALASLVSAWSVEPPLSIGLFGDWGSGKSHFMRQMRKRVETLSRAARNSKKKQNEIGYYKNIVQIEFNAWHYIEGNLWASLVDHIFANLRIKEKEKETFVEARRKELVSQLGVKKDIEAKLTDKIEERKTQLAAKEQQITDLQSDKQVAATQLDGFRNEAEDLLNQLPVKIEFSTEDAALLKRVGIEPSKLASVGDVRNRYKEAKSFTQRMLAQWKLFWTDPRVKRRWLLAALLVLIPSGGVLLAQLPQVTSLPAALGSALMFAGTLYAAAKPTWEQFRKALTALEEQDQKVEHERQKRMEVLRAEVNALAKTVVDTDREAQAIRSEIGNLQTQIDTNTTSRILAEFIEDRAAATDYRRHLGLLALIRRDFEKLRDLFDEQRREETDGVEIHDKKRINRIILYIDDLDRCPPQRVVDVLQAIHLLLAFPIFVVVVGVDARWVTRSLQESYEWLRVEEDDRNEKKADRHEENEDEHMVEGATPHDYLEKIFQIPFWLRPLGETQTKIFIEGLTDQIRYKPSSETKGTVGQSSNGHEQSTETEEAGEPRQPLKQDEPVGSNGDSATSDENLSAVLTSNNTEADTGKLVEEPVVIDQSSTAEHEFNDNETNDEKRKTETTGTPNQEDGEKSEANIEEEDDESDDTDSDSDAETGDKEQIDLSPVSLTLGDHEIEYMKSLAKLIDRSPRSIKRFLNCYRLIKVSLAPEQLDKFVQDGASYQYKAVMILLGLITGAPAVSLYLMEELENWRWQEKTTPSVADFLQRISGNEELERQRDWKRVKDFLGGFGASEESVRLFAALRSNRAKVSRYSFRVTRAEASGPKRTSVSSKSSPKKESSPRVTSKGIQMS